MQFKYKTQNMSSSRDKQNIFFCCHPQDFNSFFSVISDEILSKQNCAIWYLTNYTSTNNSLDLFDQMQLFVVPITNRILTTENPAISTYIPTAFSKHIPILPIIVEKVSLELYKEKFGNIQYLNKFENDFTAISYQKKLEDYLASALTDNKLTDKIKSAFDAYIFLSYRKKDRKYAQELIKLIHSNEMFTNIAIWYDEFLIPGEDFNSTIEQAITKSDIFVLALTPNTLKDDNYILTTEYPLAKKLEKNILPLKITEVDLTDIESHFKGIPAHTDATNKIALENALKNILSKLKIELSPPTPSKNYLIGLAYLNGIDVEVDYDKAVTLIKSAANAGLPEANEKLATMYTIGNGVKQNLQEAVLWRDKHLRIMHSKAVQTKSTQDWVAVITSLLRRSEAFDRMGDYKNKKTDLSKIIDLSLQLAKRDKNKNFNTIYATACTQLAQTEEDFSINEAKKEYEHIIKYIKKHSKKTKRKDLNILIKLYWAQLLYNNFSLTQNIKPKKAIKNIIKTNSELEYLYEHHNNNWFSEMLFAGNVFVGNYFFNLDDYNNAIKFYENAINVGTKNGSVINPLLIYSNLADSYESIEKHEQASKYYTKIQNTTENSGTGNPSDDVDYIIKKGDTYVSMQNYSEAIKQYFIAETNQKKILEENETESNYRTLSEILLKTANQFNVIKDYTNAKKYFLESIEILQKICQNSESYDNYYELSNAFYGLGNCEENIGNTSAALSCFYKMYTAIEYAHKINENKEISFIVPLILSYYNIGRLDPDKSHLLNLALELLNTSESCIAYSNHLRKMILEAIANVNKSKNT